ARRLVETICAGALDAVVLHSSSAAQGALLGAERAGLGTQLRAVLSGQVGLWCADEATATPLREQGVPARVLALAAVPLACWGSGTPLQQVAELIALECGQRMEAAGHRLDIRAQGVLVDGAVLRL